MKQVILGIVCFMLFANVTAQNTGFDQFKQKKQQAWAEYKDTKQKAWADFRKKLNNEYADKMSRQWTKHQAQAPIPVPKRPEPPKPVTKTDNAPVPTRSVSVKEFIPYVANVTPQPFQPIARPVNEQAAAFTFNYLNTPCKVHLSSDMFFSLPNVSESTVSEAWRLLSSSGYDIVADDCLNEVVKHISKACERKEETHICCDTQRCCGKCHDAVYSISEKLPEAPLCLAGNSLDILMLDPLGPESYPGKDTL